MKINDISPDKHKYLQILVDIVKPPKSLSYIGVLPDDRTPTVAIVGTRKPSTYGKEVTHDLAFNLAKRGVIIVSGLALGVDAIAHKAALEAGGTTIAVLGNGLPRIYPAANQHLAKNIIAQGGAIISEYGRDEAARPHYFLERNRLVSGLADVIVITEAAARSGTLNTAGHALEQGKDIFVVPGNITSPLSAGCNALLSRGATPATSYEDILHVVAPDALEPQAQLTLGSTPQETKLLELIRSGVRDGEQLQVASGLEAAEFSRILTMMELSGLIRPLGGNQWSL